MTVERSAKIVLYSPGGIILPYGESGRLNLPGGGIEPGEIPIEALGREMEEEIGLPIDEVAVRWVGKRKIRTTTKQGVASTRHWDIFRGVTEFRANDLMYGDDIRGIAELPESKLGFDSRVNPSARMAVELSRRSILKAVRSQVR